MGRDPAKIRRAYDAVAKEYAEKFLPEHQNKPKDREILRRFSREIRDRKPVWDFGCGPGQTTRYLNNLGLEISGLDLSEKILEQARSAHPGIHFRPGNMLKLECAGNSIAGVVSFYAIIHFTREEVGTTFREIFRVLQPGGIFLLAYHLGDETLHFNEFLGKKIDIEVTFFPAEFISGCLQKTGFEKIETIERDPYPEVEYQSRRAYVFAYKTGGKSAKRAKEDGKKGKKEE